MKRKFAIIFMVLGVACVLGAASLLLYNRWDENRAFEISANTADVLIGEIQHASLSAEVTEEKIERFIIDGQSYIGYLEIPALELLLPVMETWDDDKLKISPCRFSGSTAKDNIVIAAHNYQRHFGGISLLEYGEPIRFTDANGDTHYYTVEETETLKSTEVEEMMDSGYDLTLFTCTPGGQARVALRCVRNDDVEDWFPKNDSNIQQ